LPETVVRDPEPDEGVETLEEPRPSWAATVKLLLVLLSWLLVAALVVAASLRDTGDSSGHFAGLDWFDPFFLYYNVFLSLFGVLIVPAIVYFYVRQMKTEKARRLRRDMGTERWAKCRAEVMPLIERQFRLPSYLGSLFAVMVVITVGAAIMLLMKPYFPSVPPEPPPTLDARGVNFGRGANILMAGPFVRDYPELSSGSPLGDLDRFYDQIVLSLTAFQFGFLGAYVYFIGSLLRSYFTLDLTSHTLVAGTIRMVTSSVLALVLSFMLPTILPGDASSPGFLRSVPVIAFFLGYFPNRGLLWLERWGNKLLGLGPESYRQTPLGELDGMSSTHQARLEREGFDNAENLAHARALDLAVRTGFGYRQLRFWIGQARLRLRLGPDFDSFAQATWLRTEYQVEELYDSWAGPPEEATAHLAAACPGMEARVRDLAVLLGRGGPPAEPAG
jgi:hypothetical protein